MTQRLNNVTLLINNEQIAYIANSLKISDGFGTYESINVVLGGGQTEKIFAEDLESRISKISFSMPSTVEAHNLKRQWKSNLDNNVIEVIGPSGSGFTAVFTQASMMNDPDTVFGKDGVIEPEFEANPAQ